MVRQGASSAIGCSAARQDHCHLWKPKAGNRQGFDPGQKIHGDSVPLAAMNRPRIQDLASTVSLRQIIYKK